MAKGSWVYFIRCPSTGLIKIGFTRGHPDDRFRGIETMNSGPLEKLAVLPGPKDYEVRLHRRFAALRSHGEWFRPGPRLVAFVARWAKPWPAPDRGSRAHGLPDGQEFFTVKEAALFSGIKTDRIYVLCLTGRLPHRRVGKNGYRVEVARSGVKYLPGVAAGTTILSSASRT